MGVDEDVLGIFTTIKFDFYAYIWKHFENFILLKPKSLYSLDILKVYFWSLSQGYYWMDFSQKPQSHLSQISYWASIR